MLRLLQEKSIERLGGREAIPVDVRIIAATNRDLEDLISKGQFRNDLYYRLKVISIILPPLSERTGDIPLLADYFLKRFSMELGIENPGITQEATSKLVSKHWPGNIRELSNVIQKALIFNRGAPLNEADIDHAAGEDVKFEKHAEDVDGIRGWVREMLLEGGQNNLFETCIDTIGRLLILEALELTGGNRTKAAKILGMSRPTLHAKIDKYNLNKKTNSDPI